MVKKVFKTLIIIPLQVIVKSLIYAFGNVFLFAARYDLTRIMFNHAIWGKGSTPAERLNNLIIRQLNNSDVMQNAIIELLNEEDGEEIDREGIVELNKNDRTNQDLFYSLQHVKFYIRGRKIDNIWHAVVNVTDKYDFDVLRCAKKVTFKNAANDLGFVMQKLGMMYPYAVDVSYEIERPAEQS